MGGGGDANHVVVQMKASGDFGKDGAMRLFAAGNLRGSKSGGAGDGSVDEGELLSAEAGQRKIGDVGEAEGVSGFEGGYEAVDFLLHNNNSISIFGFPSQNERRITGDYPPVGGKFNPFFCHRDTENAERLFPSTVGAESL